MTDSATVNRRRSQRLKIQVPILIQVTLSDRKSVQVQAFTLEVNAHGGLLESPVKTVAGQKIVLVNPRSGKEVRCRVLRSEKSSSGLYLLAFDFDVRNAQFWPINFPPDDWTVAEKLANKATAT